MHTLASQRRDERAAADPEEAVLVALFRGIDAKARELALSLMRGYEAPPKSVSISVSGDLAQMAQAEKVAQSNVTIATGSRRRKAE